MPHLPELAHDVAAAVAAALPEEAPVTADEIAGLLQAPPDPSLGDLSLPCFRLAKALRTPPPKIAADLAARLADDPLVERAATAGPYLNLRLSLAAAAERVLVPWAAATPGDPPRRETKVMVEFSQPNTHKAFHVGHMRNLCLGDSIVRLLRAEGYPTVAANYLGDMGVHIAKCLWWYLDVLSDDERRPPERHRGEWLGEIYAKAARTLAEWKEAAGAGDAEAAARLEAANARITEIHRKLEARDPELTEVWERTRRWSIEEFDEIYDWCGVRFDHVFYESDVDRPGLALVEEYLQKGLFVESEGAVGIVNEEVPHMPFFMLRKSDGTGLYATKDLALAILKFEEFGIDRSIYVVDSRQTDHFRHVFLTLEKMGFEQARACEHVPYEMVELPSGPMSTRTGNVVLFRALRETMTRYVEEHYLAKYRGDWSDEEIARVAHQVALGAIKYGMLARDVNQKIVFDMEAWLQLEGNTGPYLQYVVARSRSILRKCAEVGKTLDPAVLEPGPARTEACAALTTGEEREVVLALAEFPAVVRRAAEQLRPHQVCGYLFDLAKRFNRFNRACPVKPSEGAVLQGRLLVVRAVVHALVHGLDLLGIPAPERM